MTKLSSPKIYGLIGYPVKHSLSPVMHNEAFKHLNIDAEYRLFEIKPEELEDFLRGDILVKDTNDKSCLAKDIVGFNITIPHKIHAFKFIENTTIVQPLDITLLLANAVNTIKRENGKLYYRNTDTIGFVNSLREDLKFNATGKTIIVFGCGGAGRAVIAGLLQEGMNVRKIYIYDINNEVMEAAKKHFSKPGFVDFVNDKLEFISAEQVPEKIKECNLLVNASPVGMKEGDRSIIDKNLLHEDLSVYDVVYNRKTQLIKDAESLKLSAKDGLGMLLYQGAEAFKFWTGQEAPVEIMRRALEAEIKKCRD